MISEYVIFMFNSLDSNYHINYTEVCDFKLKNDQMYINKQISTGYLFCLDILPPFCIKTTYLYYSKIWQIIIMVKTQKQHILVCSL